MSIIKVDYGTIGGGIDISNLIGEYICNSATVYATPEIILTSVVGIKDVDVEIAGSTGCKIYGYIGTTKTDLTTSYVLGTQTLDVSAYERISAQAGNASGHTVKVKVVD